MVYSCRAPSSAEGNGWSAWWSRAIRSRPILKPGLRGHGARRWEDKGRCDLRTSSGWQEVDLRDKVKTTGGLGNPARRLWELRYDCVVTLGLEDRIIRDFDDQPGKHLDVDTSIYL